MKPAAVVASCAIAAAAYGQDMRQVVFSQNNLVVYGTTLVDIPDMSFPVVAGSTYTFRYAIVFQTTNTADGARFDVAGPAAYYVHRSRETMIVATNSTDGYSSRYLSGFGGDTATPSVSPANSNHYARGEGIFCPSANGTVKLQAAGELATTQLTIVAPCMFEVRRIGP